MSKVGDYKIPFRKNRMLEYVETWWDEPEWRDNITFRATLELQGHYRGRSAARVTVKNVENGEEYSMGFGAFYDAVATQKVLKGGKIQGTWTFRKQGANYGLVPVGEHGNQDRGDSEDLQYDR